MFCISAVNRRRMSNTCNHPWATYWGQYVSALRIERILEAWLNSRIIWLQSKLKFIIPPDILKDTQNPIFLESNCYVLPSAYAFVLGVWHVRWCLFFMYQLKMKSRGPYLQSLYMAEADGSVVKIHAFFPPLIHIWRPLNLLSVMAHYSTCCGPECSAECSFAHKKLKLLHIKYHNLLQNSLAMLDPSDHPAWSFTMSACN